MLQGLVLHSYIKRTLGVGSGVQGLGSSGVGLRPRGMTRSEAIDMQSRSKKTGAEDSEFKGSRFTSRTPNQI